MEITEVKQQKRNRERFNIYIDGKFMFSASAEDTVKLSICEGKIIDEQQLSELREKCENTRAYNYALTLLGRMDYTTRQIRQKLQQRCYSDYTINIIIDKLSDYGLINDNIYAKNYISQSLNSKKYGRKKILLNLQKAGIQINDIEDNQFDESIELDNLRELALKKLRILGENKNKKQKLYHYLLSKGYEYGLINIVLKEIFHDEDFEGY